MYKMDDGQISISEFLSPFGMLDPHNRWVRMADAIPWGRYEALYAGRFNKNGGAPAIRFRMAMGTLLIKHKTGRSDRETLLSIAENPYMQYLIGLREFTAAAPFSVSSIGNFRKYITRAMIKEINRDISAKKTDRGKPGNV